MTIRKCDGEQARRLRHRGAGRHPARAPDRPREHARPGHPQTRQQGLRCSPTWICRPTGTSCWSTRPASSRSAARRAAAGTLTGHKIIVDTYGEWLGTVVAPSPAETRPSRPVTAYAMRWWPRTSSPGWPKCEVQVAYAIGVSTSGGALRVQTFRRRTAVPDEQIQQAVEVFDLRPAAIVRGTRSAAPDLCTGRPAVTSAGSCRTSRGRARTAHLRSLRPSKASSSERWARQRGASAAGSQAHSSRPAASRTAFSNASGSATVTVSPGCRMMPDGSRILTGSLNSTQTPPAVVVPNVAPLSLNEPLAPIAFTAE
ncbi:MAG: methionine adenosyltransferase domain-containing protein [Actinobacteria bacterium]|nr:methionine adenosyltransferase domain-containing protein [Actinomycetota bacterium]